MAEKDEKDPQGDPLAKQEHDEKHPEPTVSGPAADPLAKQEAEQDGEDEDTESTVNDPLAPREDDVARQRSTSPVPRVGDTWEDMHDHDTNGPQRRVGILEISDDGRAYVENKVTRHHSWISLESFSPPKWRFIG